MSTNIDFINASRHGTMRFSISLKISLIGLVLALKGLEIRQGVMILPLACIFIIGLTAMPKTTWKKQGRTYPAATGPVKTKAREGRGILSWQDGK